MAKPDLVTDLVCRGDQQAFRRLVDIALSGIIELPPPQQRRLFEALRAVQRAASRSDAAATLALGKRGLERRLERVHELTSLDPGLPRERFVLDLAMSAHDAGLVNASDRRRSVLNG